MAWIYTELFIQDGVFDVIDKKPKEVINAPNSEWKINKYSL